MLMAHLDTLTTNAERKHIYTTLGSTSSLALKRRVLEWTTSGAVKLQDFFYAIGSVSQSSPEGLELAWAFYQESLPKLKAMIAKASPSLMDAAIVYSVAGYLPTDNAHARLHVYLSPQAHMHHSRLLTHDA